MTHWRHGDIYNDEGVLIAHSNKSRKKKHQKQGVMTKKQLREFFGHRFPGPFDKLEKANSATDSWFE